MPTGLQGLTVHCTGLNPRYEIVANKQNKNKRVHLCEMVLRIWWVFFLSLLFLMKVPCNFPNMECLECVCLSVFQFQPAGSSSIWDLWQTAQTTSAGCQWMFRRLWTGIDSHVPRLVFSGLFDWTVVFPTIRMPVCAVTLDPAPNLQQLALCDSASVC